MDGEGLSSIFSYSTEKRSVSSFVFSGEISSGVTAVIIQTIPDTSNGLTDVDLSVHQIGYLVNHSVHINYIIFHLFIIS